jgi:hypothetical protein
VKDISATGVYVLTDERWPEGELMTLTLQRQVSPKLDPELRVSIEARVARVGEDGIGLMLVPPEGFNPGLWGALLRNAVYLIDHKELLHTFRMIRAVLFLHRLCSTNAEEAVVVIGGELNALRTGIAFDIAFRAEKMLAEEPVSGRLRAPGHVVASILRNGSWENDELIERMWAGMLVSSGTLTGSDQSSLELVDLMTRVTPIQAKIFQAGCRKALETMQAGEAVPRQPIIVTPEEIVEITDMHDLSRVAMNVAYLFNHGLFKEVFDFTSYLPTESFNITPTKLGLELYRRCRVG